MEVLSVKPVDGAGATTSKLDLIMQCLNADHARYQKKATSTLMSNLSSSTLKSTSNIASTSRAAEVNNVCKPRDQDSIHEERVACGRSSITGTHTQSANRPQEQSLTITVGKRKPSTYCEERKMYIAAEELCMYLNGGVNYRAMCTQYISVMSVLANMISNALIIAREFEIFPVGTMKGVQSTLLHLAQEAIVLLAQSHISAPPGLLSMIGSHAAEEKLRREAASDDKSTEGTTADESISAVDRPRVRDCQAALSTTALSSASFAPTAPTTRRSSVRTTRHSSLMTSASSLNRCGATAPDSTINTIHTSIPNNHKNACDSPNIRLSSAPNSIVLAPASALSTAAHASGDMASTEETRSAMYHFSAPPTEGIIVAGGHLSNEATILLPPTFVQPLPTALPGVPSSLATNPIRRASQGAPDHDRDGGTGSGAGCTTSKELTATRQVPSSLLRCHDSNSGSGILMRAISDTRAGNAAAGGGSSSCYNGMQDAHVNGAATSGVHGQHSHPTWIDASPVSDTRNAIIDAKSGDEAANVGFARHLLVMDANKNISHNNNSCLNVNQRVGPTITAADTLRVTYGSTPRATAATSAAVASGMLRATHGTSSDHDDDCDGHGCSTHPHTRLSTDGSPSNGASAKEILNGTDAHALLRSNDAYTRKTALRDLYSAGYHGNGRELLTDLLSLIFTHEYDQGGGVADVKSTYATFTTDVHMCADELTSSPSALDTRVINGGTTPHSVYLSSCRALQLEPRSHLTDMLQSMNNAVYGQRQLSTLSLSGWRLGSRHVIAALTVVPWLYKLRHLDLSGNDLHEDVCETLCRALQHHPALQRVNLSDNGALGGQRCVEAVVAAVRTMPQMTELNVQGCLFTPLEQKQMMAVLKNVPARVGQTPRHSLEVHTTTASGSTLEQRHRRASIPPTTTTVNNDHSSRSYNANIVDHSKNSKGAPDKVPDTSHACFDAASATDCVVPSINATSTTASRARAPATNKASPAHRKISTSMHGVRTSRSTTVSHSHGAHTHDQTKLTIAASPAAASHERGREGNETKRRSSTRSLGTATTARSPSASVPHVSSGGTRCAEKSKLSARQTQLPGLTKP